ncbi:polysaccharide deacetylase family protein [uncultured Tenacibaculum sp.]|uniref:polysaccharide deacetylase family protein n=1 Tax=uncultured Tenacibaculum sp. TaxID=174713 RepID=UPI002620ACA1|nr:polysaccharide deacetylase family protein [uncultured Tenacibaculum sp.]
MRLYFIKTPHILKKLFPKYTWCFPSVEKEIYLTFDDGPIPVVTEFVLDELQKYKAKATFFCIGDNIKKHSSIFSRIVKEGHSIGNHTFNHLNGWKTTNKNYRENIELCEKIILKEAVKLEEFKEVKLFRPPYGKIKGKQGKELLKKGYKVIMWDVLSADFDATVTKEKCLSNVVDNAEKGSVIIFHDSIKASRSLYYVLPKILEEYTKKGYKFKAIL